MDLDNATIENTIYDFLVEEYGDTVVITFFEKDGDLDQYILEIEVEGNPYDAGIEYDVEGNLTISHFDKI